MDKLPNDCIAIILKFCERNNNAVFLAMACKLFYKIATECRLDLRFYFRYCMAYDLVASQLFKSCCHYRKKSMIRLWNRYNKADNLLANSKYTFSDEEIFDMPCAVLDVVCRGRDLERLFQKAKKYYLSGSFISWYIRRNNYDFMDVNVLKYNNIAQDVYDTYIKLTSHKFSIHVWRQCTLSDKNKYLHRIDDKNTDYTSIFAMSMAQIEERMDEFPDLFATFAVMEDRPDIMVAFLRYLKPSTRMYWTFHIVDFLATTDNVDVLREVGENIPQAGIEALVRCSIRGGTYRNFELFRRLLKKPLPGFGPAQYGAYIPLDIALTLSNWQKRLLLHHHNYIEILDHIELETDPIKVFEELVQCKPPTAELLHAFIKKFIPQGVKTFKFHYPRNGSLEKLNYLIDTIPTKECHMDILQQIIRWPEYDKVSCRILAMYDEFPPDVLHHVCFSDSWIKYRALRRYFPVNVRMTKVVQTRATYILKQELEIFGTQAVYKICSAFEIEKICVRYEMKRQNISRHAAVRFLSKPNIVS